MVENVAARLVVHGLSKDDDNSRLTFSWRLDVAAVVGRLWTTMWQQPARLLRLRLWGRHIVFLEHMRQPTPDAKHDNTTIKKKVIMSSSSALLLLLLLSMLERSVRHNIPWRVAWEEGVDVAHGIQNVHFFRQGFMRQTIKFALFFRRLELWME